MKYRYEFRNEQNICLTVTAVGLNEAMEEYKKWYKVDKVECMQCFHMCAFVKITTAHCTFTRGVTWEKV